MAESSTRERTLPKRRICGKIALEEAVGSPVFFVNSTYPPKPLIPGFTGLPIRPDVVADVNLRLNDIELRLQSMDESGIEHAILSMASPGIEGIFDPKTAVDYAQKTNNALYEAYVKPHPDRFSFFASVPMQDPEAAAVELKRAVTTLGAKGAHINGYTNLDENNMDSVRYLDHPICEPFWSALADLDVPLYLHPRNPPPGQQLLYASYPGLAQAAFGFGVETAGHALRIMCSGILDRYPSVRIILGHCAEALPFQIHRIDERMKLAVPGTNGPYKKSLREYLQENFYATLAGVRSEIPLRATLDEMGESRVMFSVVYPYESNKAAADWFDNLEINENTRATIGWGNAQKLFKINLSDRS